MSPLQPHVHEKTHQSEPPKKDQTTCPPCPHRVPRLSVCVYSRSFTRCVTPRKTTMRLAPASVGTTPCSESCPDGSLTHRFARLARLLACYIVSLPPFQPAAHQIASMLACLPALCLATSQLATSLLISYPI